MENYTSLIKRRLKLLKNIIISNIIKYMLLLLISYIWIEDKNIIKSIQFSSIVIFSLLIYDIYVYIKKGQKK